MLPWSTTQKTDTCKKKVFALGSTVVSCKDASTNVKTSRTTTSACCTWPPFSLRSLSLCYDNTNPFRTRKNSSRRQMRLICNNPRPRRAHAVPPKHGREEQRLLARIRNMLIRSKRKDAENGRGAAAFGPTIYRSQRHHSTRMSDEGMQEFPIIDFFL